MLARYGQGLSVTQLADEIGALRTNASVHLAVLRNAGLMTSHRQGRSITYEADHDALRSLTGFLAEAAG